MRRLYFFSKLEDRLRSAFERFEFLKMRFIDTGNNAPLGTHYPCEFSHVSSIIFTELENKNLFVPFQTAYELRNTKRGVVTSRRSSDLFTFREYCSEDLAHTGLPVTPCYRNFHALVTLQSKVSKFRKDIFNWELGEAQFQYGKDEAREHNKRSFEKYEERNY